MKYVKIEFDDESQYEQLKETKEHHGMTWKGMLLHAQRDLEGVERDE